MTTDVQGWVQLLGRDGWRSDPRSAIIEQTEGWYTVWVTDGKFTNIPLYTTLVAAEVSGLGPPVAIPLDAPRFIHRPDDVVQITDIRFPVDQQPPTSSMTTGYEVGYAEGQANVRADWEYALSEELGDDDPLVHASPGEVAAEIARLRSKGEDPEPLYKPPCGHVFTDCPNSQVICDWPAGHSGDHRRALRPRRER